MGKPIAQIKYFASGSWHDLPRTDAAAMLREARGRYHCDRIYDRVYILHPAREYDSATFIRTNLPPVTPLFG